MSGDLDKLHAKLALELSRDKAVAVGDPPSSEELAALADGALDHTRRAQVMSHLAADETLYTQWIALQDALAFVEGERQPEPAPEVVREGLFARLGQWLRAPAFAGAATAMLFVALVVPNIRPDYSREMDRLYDTAVPMQFEQARSAGQMGRIDRAPGVGLSTTRQLMEAGALAGLEKIAPDQGLPGVSTDQLQKLSLVNRLGLVRSSWRARYELGRLTAIATLQCRANIVETDYKFVVTQFAAIREALAAQDELSEQAAIMHILNAIEQAGDDRYRACLAASRGLNFLRSSPV